MTTTPREDPPSPPRVSISVRNPRTHGEGSDAYTSYLIYFDSNDQAFSNVHSEARRRYSDFVWLRKHLADRFHKKTPPKLPPKTFFQSKLDPLVVENRKMGLEKFLCDVLKDREYLPDIRLHLFLQTDMPVDNIESSVSGISTHAPFTMTVVTERAVSEDSCPLNGILDSEEEDSIAELRFPHPTNPLPPPGPALIQHNELPPSPSPNAAARTTRPCPIPSPVLSPGAAAQASQSLITQPRSPQAAAKADSGFSSRTNTENYNEQIRKNLEMEFEFHSVELGSSPGLVICYKCPHSEN